jgi:hypothetical protein
MEEETNEKLLSKYSSLSNYEKSQFISALIGEHNLLKDMGSWFEPNPFLSLFSNEFEKGYRNKCLIRLAEIDSSSIKKTENKCMMKIFWIPSENEEHNVLFNQIMKSKDYIISETTCLLNYDSQHAIRNNVEIDSQYTLAFGHVKFEDAKHMGTVIKGNNGGFNVKLKGLLATLS